MPEPRLIREVYLLSKQKTAETSTYEFRVITGRSRAEIRTDEQRVIELNENKR